MLKVVLLEPETSGNIGSICRVMANFGFSELVLVRPKASVDEDARRFAKNAQDVVKRIKVVKSPIDKALSKFDYVVGTTSKLGRDYNIPRSPITPEMFARKLGEVNLEKKNIALVLGREGDGLYNHELEMCDFVVSIPTSKDYDSMNISHALAVLLYELRKNEFGEGMMKGYTPIGEADKRQVMKLLDVALDRMDFRSEDKKDTQRKVWRRMITKSFMTRREAFALMGFLKKIR
ncbi:RNA methyltransferase [Candidatus Woesearchaeota archaeon]|nr:RNA methyltransferase [Candidatus Woesearchaeota archaeon]